MKEQVERRRGGRAEAVRDQATSRGKERGRGGEREGNGRLQRCFHRIRSIPPILAGMNTPGYTPLLVW